MKIQKVINTLLGDSIIMFGLIFLLVLQVIRCEKLEYSLEELKKKVALLKQDNVQDRVRYTERITKLQDYVDELIRDGKYKDKQIYELSKKLERLEE